MNIEAVKTFYDLLGHKKQTEIRTNSVYGFVGQLVSNPEIFQEIESIIQKNNLILYNGTFKPYKKYHITLKAPNLSENILPFESSESIQEATITGLSIFSDKLVYLLDNKKHITIAEGDKQKVIEILNSNKYEFEKLIGKKVLFLKPEFIFANPSKNQSRSYFVSSEEEFVSKVQELNGKYNLYAGLNERIENGTEAKDVLSVKRIFIDIDCKIKPANQEDLKEAERITDDIILVIEKQTDLRPTKIFSGNGYQLVYCIPEIVITDENRGEINSKIQQFLKDLMNKYNSNDKVKLDNVGDLPRIIRITGTMNIKGNKTSEFIEIHTEENQKLRDYILNLKQESSFKVGELETSLAEILEKDERVKNLFNADPEAIGKYPSRSEAEQSLVCHLIGLGLDKEQIFKIMASCRIGKWQEANIRYKILTFEKALKVITDKKRNVILTEKNPFKKLHYSTEHLCHFDKLNSILGLYGRHYLPIKKARWYQLLGGALQKKIILGEKYTDTRINCIYPLPTEQGKNDLIYLFKKVLSQVNMTIEEPISYHPEQLIGKVIEVMEDNPDGRPRKIKVKKENRGYFDSDFIEIDEANILIFNKDEQTQQAREYISKALNPIDRNEVVKKLVGDLPNERVQYCPKCTITAYFQPSKKIEENFFLQGFGRRFLIPVGNVEPFLNYGNEGDFKRKISPSEISKQKCVGDLAKYLTNVKQSMKDREFVFTPEAIEKINFYHQYLIAEGQIHSEKISNLTKLIKWTIQDYLIRMSCILASSFYTNVVDAKFVALAYMDLVELLQNTFDFIKEQVYGNFDYGTGWQGANYKEKNCLEYLYDKKAFSSETSEVSIGEFITYLEEIYKVKETRARQILATFRKKGYVDSKQTDKNETKIWLTFIPQTENLVFEGDKGCKGYNIYESVFSGINGILDGLSALSPLSAINGIPVEKVDFSELNEVFDNG